MADIVQLHKYQVLAFINVSITRKRQTGSGKIQDMECLDGKMAVLSIFNKTCGFVEKKYVAFTSERDISCYIFKNISRTKLILIHEKILI